jgi:outer membrane protein insertion porin family
VPVGKIQYYKADLQAQYYYSFSRGFILGLNLQGGYGNGIGNPYPIFKNYYAGGIGSVRGYEPSSLGPRDQDERPDRRLEDAGRQHRTDVPAAGHRLRPHAARVHVHRRRQRVGQRAGRHEYRRERSALRLWCGPRVDLADRPAEAEPRFPAAEARGDQYQKFQFQIGTAF